MTYIKPEVVDFGGLRELTQACITGTGGDSFGPSIGGYGLGKSVHNSLINCESN